MKKRNNELKHGKRKYVPQTSTTTADTIVLLTQLCHLHVTSSYYFKVVDLFILVLTFRLQNILYFMTTFHGYGVIFKANLRLLRQ